MRRGAYFYYAGSGALDIGKHARHSSNAIVGYLEGCDRATSLAQFNSVAVRKGPIDLLDFSPSPPLATTTLSGGTSLAADHHFMTLKRKGSKIHRLNSANRSSTLCRWYWPGARNITLFSQAVTCAICARRYVGSSRARGSRALESQSSESAGDQSTTESSG